MNLLLIHPNKVLLPLACAALLLVSASAAKAQILLIDVSNPEAVTFTATGSFASGNASAMLLEGIDLENFFTGTVHTDSFDMISSSLTTGNGSAGGLTFDNAIGDAFPDNLTNQSLNLYGDTSTTITFSETATALTGTITLDLQDYSLLLPNVGKSGSVYSGAFGGPSGNTLIGSWEVVSAPEPSAWALLLGGVAVFAVLRNRMGLRAKSVKRD